MYLPSCEGGYASLETRIFAAMDQINMDPKFIKSISNQVYRRFPELDGSAPKVQLQSVPQAKSISSSAKYLLTYRGKAKSPDGKTIHRLVRVIADAKGKILKITTSR